MENLPFFFLKELFSMMPGLNEVIRCSHVCRNWRAAYEALLKPETLCLHFEKTNRLIPPNHRLFYTNDPVPRLCFLKIARSSDELQFFDSPAAHAHFSNIKKLIIFSPFSSHSFYNEHVKESLRINLKNQLNHFKALEYCEIRCQVMVAEDSEIDLPNLKVLCVGWCYFEEEKGRIILNTPSLKAMKITSDWFCSHSKEARITNFKFLFPAALWHLEMIPYKKDKFETKFENLEVLVFARKSQILLPENFWESLPNLKFLFFSWYGRDAPEEMKQNFNLKDLKIFDLETGKIDRFDYQNWQWYLEHKKQLPYWPGELKLIFNKLVDCQVPLCLFEEKYFEIKLIKVRQVDDQSLLVDLLRNVQVTELKLEYDCNLGQSFIDKIADSAIPLRTFTLDECVWNRMNDFSGFTRLRVLGFKMKFQQLPAEAALAVLRNPFCVSFMFTGYRGFYGEREEMDGEVRKFTKWQYIHLIYPPHPRAGNDLKCISCGWTNADPNCFEDPLAATVQHAGKPPWMWP